MSRGSPSTTRPSSVAILGADAVLAARPASPVQLAHACRALGYDMAFPSSWGDELVAAGCLEQLREWGSDPAIVCACPRVAERLTRTGTELAPWMIALVAPPVAAARYLRAVYGARPVHITYVGACPAAHDPSIDARLSPDELLDALVERGIALADQPHYFDSMLPPDRRRFTSLPGGAPSPERVAAVDAARALVELEGDDSLVELAQHIVAHERVVIDLAPQLGCACSGATAAHEVHDARAALIAIEPPRAQSAVLDPAIVVDVRAPRPEETATPPAHEGGVGGGSAAFAPSAADATAPATTRRDPRRLITPHHVTAIPALRRADGRIVPRAYAAHTRSATTTERHEPRDLWPNSRARPVHDRPARSGTPTPGAPAPRGAATRVPPPPNDAPRLVPPPPIPPAKHRPEAVLGANTVIGTHS
jgi:hypothetical protein